MKRRLSSATGESRKRFCSSETEDVPFKDSLLESLLGSYLNPAEQTITKDGILKLCSDLDITHCDISFLSLAFALQLQKKWIIAPTEFISGLQPLGVDTIPKLRKKLPELRQLAIQNFKAVYLYSFEFLKDNPTQKLLRLSVALNVIQNLLGHLPHTYHFVNFMSHHQTQYIAMNHDQWTMFLKFNETIDVWYHGYDENDEWPVMFDDYVKFIKKNQKSIPFEHRNNFSFQKTFGSTVLHSQTDLEIEPIPSFFQPILPSNESASCQSPFLISNHSFVSSTNATSFVSITASSLDDPTPNFDEQQINISSNEDMIMENETENELRYHLSKNVTSRNELSETIDDSLIEHRFLV